VIRVFIYDDSNTRIESLKTLLDFTENMEYVGSAYNCINVNTDMLGNNPDLVLMDIEMPYSNGIEGLRQIKLHFPKIKVIMQTVYEDIEMIFSAFKFGAVGYILKKASIATITDSIEKAYEGQVFITPSVALQIMNYFNQHNVIDGKLEPLTEMEASVIQLISLGYSNKIIAEILALRLSDIHLITQEIFGKITNSIK
jgi:DNA-binding NarL/FixJ family response regulator